MLTKGCTTQMPPILINHLQVQSPNLYPKPSKVDLYFKNVHENHKNTYEMRAVASSRDQVRGMI
jgi:hypothetical protein